MTGRSFLFCIGRVACFNCLAVESDKHRLGMVQIHELQFIQLNNNISVLFLRLLLLQMMPRYLPVDIHETMSFLRRELIFICVYWLQVLQIWTEPLFRINRTGLLSCSSFQATKNVPWDATNCAGVPSLVHKKLYSLYTSATNLYSTTLIDVEQSSKFTVGIESA